VLLTVPGNHDAIDGLATCVFFVLITFFFVKIIVLFC
jgi:hypothetical protein